jgi:hypothetical protein
MNIDLRGNIGSPAPEMQESCGDLHQCVSLIPES